MVFVYFCVYLFGSLACLTCLVTLGAQPRLSALTTGDEHAFAEELVDLDALVGGRVSVPKEQTRGNVSMHLRTALI